jgi:hypothetical protein
MKVGKIPNLIIQQYGSIVYDKICGDYNDEIPDTSQEWEWIISMATEAVKIMNVRTRLLL